ncbi:hypothetical protein BDN72DRAFT_748420, partial [Pluteus cervinus]
LEARILALKTTRNTFTPISSLHPEIIQQIFFLASVELYKMNPMGKTALRISWVCQSWRDLALQTSQLWSYIEFLHPTWIETALSRTRQRPL